MAPQNANPRHALGAAGGTVTSAQLRLSLREVGATGALYLRPFAFLTVTATSAMAVNPMSSVTVSAAIYVPGTK